MGNFRIKNEAVVKAAKRALDSAGKGDIVMESSTPNNIYRTPSGFSTLAVLEILRDSGNSLTYSRAVQIICNHFRCPRSVGSVYVRELLRLRKIRKTPLLRSRDFRLEVCP